MTTDWDGEDSGFKIHDAGWAVISAVVLFGGACALIGCGRGDDGSAYARISHDKFDPCRVFVADMGRASPPVKPFVARIEGCKPEDTK